MRRIAIALVSTVGLLLGLLAQSSVAQAAPATVSKVPGGTAWSAAVFDPADYGYTETEYLISGTAKAYGENLPDHPFTTRMLVYRPADPAKFSGNVIAEWTNVTSQVDHPFEFQWLNRQVMANGDAYAIISAQQAGACGFYLTGEPMVQIGDLEVPVCTPISLKGRDPVKYRDLHAPGDVYAFDVFSQTAATLRNTTGVAPLGGLVPDNIIAIGLSQSGMALDNYIRLGADDDAQVFDGFIIDGDMQARLPDSYRVPTMHIWSEESGQLGVPTASENHRVWSIAGASHVDGYQVRQVLELLVRNQFNLPRMTKREYEASVALGSDYGQEGFGAGTVCVGSSQLQRGYAVNAAVTAMQHWVRTGEPASIAEPFEYNGYKKAVDQIPFELVSPLPFAGARTDFIPLLGSMFALERDGHGNARGGVRLPAIEVPVARYDGSACSLFGTTYPFMPDELKRLYPTHEVYVTKMLAATRESVNDRFMTRRDGIEQMTKACNSAIPDWGVTPKAQQPHVCHDLDNAI